MVSVVLTAGFGLAAAPAASADPGADIGTDAAVPAHPTTQDVTDLGHRLAAAERNVLAASRNAQLAADAALRLRSAELDAERAAAVARESAHRQIWSLVESGPDPGAQALVLPGVPAGPSGALSAEGVDLLRQVQQRRLDRQRASISGARGAVDRLTALRATSLGARSAARQQAGRASGLADEARRMLETAHAQAHADQVAAQQARDVARAAAALTEELRLADLQARLDAADAALVRAVAPVAAVDGAPVATGTLAPAVASPDVPDAGRQTGVLALLDATPAGGLPRGYRTTGQVVTGEGSWYGPGFIGSPTSSGTPYDPEQLTCAMLAVPLGTVVRVTTAAGRSVVVLVTDHGPYEPGRVIDLSMRANRVVGLGLGAVRVEVLATA